MGNIYFFNDGEIETTTKIEHNTVYHYTSPSGIFSILNDEKLWFTDCQYLNDKSEYIFIRRPLLKAFEEIGPELDEKIDEKFISFIDRLLFSKPYQNKSIKGSKFSEIKIKRYRFYVFCTSTISDTQNMWNYYVKNGQYLGYNLGINVNKVIDKFSDMPEISMTHGKVIYDECEQIDQIKTFLESLYNQMKLIQEEYDKAKIDEAPPEVINYYDDYIPETYQNTLLDFIDERRLFFKNKAFESEKEYRFVAKVADDFKDNKDENNFLLKHRIGENGVIIPYRELNIENRNSFLNQITLSPMMEMDLSRSGLKSFLGEDTKKISIINSDIEIRF